MSSAVPKEKGMREYRKTGLFTLKRALIDLGSRAIDGRSSVGVALRRWKADLAQDLRGDDSISTQQETLIELAPCRAGRLCAAPCLGAAQQSRDHPISLATGSGMTGARNETYLL